MIGVWIQTEHERYLTEEYLKRPVVVMNYPKEIKAFYMSAEIAGGVVRCRFLVLGSRS